MPRKDRPQKFYRDLSGLLRNEEGYPMVPDADKIRANEIFGERAPILLGRVNLAGAAEFAGMSNNQDILCIATVNKHEFAKIISHNDGSITYLPSLNTLAPQQFKGTNEVTDVAAAERFWSEYELTFPSQAKGKRPKTLNHSIFTTSLHPQFAK